MDSAADSADAGAPESGAPESGAVNKHSYTVPCASAFRDAVEALAAKRRVNVGDIARSVLLVVNAGQLQTHPDPGEPPHDDRETVILKSGPAQGRPWRRKPRLQVRMAPGYEIALIRRALAVALALDKGELQVRLGDPRKRRPPAPPPPPPPAPPAHDGGRALEAVNEEIERMKAVIAVLAFEPLPDGVVSRAEALHVLGFPPGARPDRRTLRARFRMLATIHHPDSHYGSHLRMSQLNHAMDVLTE